MTRALSTAAAALALAACSYDFTNPAEELQSGQVTGRVVADVSGTGTFSALPGVAVALENGPFDQVTRETGRFTLLGLPPGRHTVLFRKGTTWALQRDVDVAFGPDGQPEGVVLGDVRLRYTVTLQGTFSLPPPPPGTTFTPDPATWTVEDESTGMRAALSSGPAPGQIAYRLQGLPVGTHRIRFAVGGTLTDPLLLSSPQSYVGGPIVLTVPESSEGQALTLNPVALAATGTDLGKLRFKIAVVASRLVNPGGSSVTLTPAPPPEANLTPDSTGLVEADLPEGVYTLEVFPPVEDPVGGGQPLFLTPPPKRTIVIGKDQVTELGVLYAVEDSVAVAESLTCWSDADCAPGTCTGGFCAGWTPPPVAPASVPFCAADPAGDCASFSCVPCARSAAGSFGTCMPNPAGGYVCMPVGATSCTPDGVNVADDIGC